jgi:1,4-dihydroxy-2-naphthoate octaprenyltransferase
VKKIIFWIRNARPVALPQSIFPAVLAVMMAFGSSGFSFLCSIAAMIGVVFLHLSMNLFDDYFDYKNHDVEIRKELADNTMLSRTGKCKYLISQEASLKQLFYAATFFLFIAAVFGGIIFLYRGMVILYLMLIGGVLGFFYSAKPLRLSYHGLGELTVGIMFGPLLMTGMFYAACGVYRHTIGFVSCSVGLLVANILFTHSILDYHPDRYVRKKTLAVLMKSSLLQFVCSCVLTLLPFVLIGYGILFDYLSTWYALTLLVFPLGIYLMYLMFAYFRYPQKQFSPSFLLQPMENWDKIQRDRISWFMIRWYLSRNLTVFFCVLAVIASILSL